MPRTPIDYSALTELRCSRCDTVKPVLEFGRTNDKSAPLTGWRYRSWCRDCNRAHCKEYGATHKPERCVRMKKWRKANPEKAKIHDRNGRHKMMYGLPPDIYALMLKKQRGRCAICRAVKPLCVDHHHATGAVRKLLCSRCNFIVGIVENCAKVLDGAREYLRSFSE